ncbi:hypothetical protein [Demequina subtropica]|uniref:hypothetical protein n=1 Tax=Demequina subtropica TaxID=1638989 RepID=UPI000781B457|nr:hypothetical protein [Demequina subtropica]
MSAAKPDVSIDLSDESAVMWLWGLAQTLAVAIIAGFVFQGDTDAFSWGAFGIGALVGAISTVPAFVLFSVAARILTFVGVTTRQTRALLDEQEMDAG